MYKHPDMLKGRVVFGLRRGQFPPSSLIRELQERNPNAVYRVETITVPYTTFVVTAAPYKR